MNVNSVSLIKSKQKMIADEMSCYGEGIEKNRLHGALCRRGGFKFQGQGTTWRPWRPQGDIIFL